LIFINISFILPLRDAKISISKMKHTQIEWDDLCAVVRLGSFIPTTGVAEFHAIIELSSVFENTEKQYHLLAEAAQRLTQLPELKGATLVWKRFFVSDAINHAPYLIANAGESVSVVQQPPLNGAKASVWLYLAEDAQLSNDADGAVIMKRPNYSHLFHTQLHERSTDKTESTSHSPLTPHPTSIEHQTGEIFNRYSRSLSRHGCTLERNCIRTWIFVQDVDVQYAGMVAARREYFEREGLTPQTHYIASTGIEGRYIHPDVLALMDAYAVAGINPAQIRYLKAFTHLNPTYEYGVTFERGTSVDYGDRRHIFISGTASINNRGEIVHPLDIEKQTARTFENVQALLAEAKADLDDAAHLIVYLRDTADYAVVNRYLEQHYPRIPRVLALAPVCRPGWLVEVECMAIKMIENKQFAAF
jgi:enamine deaminase RidA (YjgF/YER057c/UK114 family)